jgi:hypothetical protein
MRITSQDDVLWAEGFLTTVVVLLLLLWRRRWRQFPILTSWMAYQTAWNIAMYLLYAHDSRRWYARVYWGSLWPDFLLQVGVTLEIARMVLRPAASWGRGTRDIFVAAGLGWAAVAALLSWWITPPHGAYSAWDLRADLFTSLMTCGLLVSVTVIANWLRLARYGHVAAIAEALTMWTSVMLIINALQSYRGVRNFRQLSHFQSYAWIGAMLWIALDFGLPGPSVEIPSLRPVAESPQSSGDDPPRMLRLLSPGSLLEFRKVFNCITGILHHSRPAPSVKSINGADA